LTKTEVILNNFISHATTARLNGKFVVTVYDHTVLYCFKAKVLINE